MLFFIAACTTVVLLACIGNLIEYGMSETKRTCQERHVWVEETDPAKRAYFHYLVCKECGKVPGHDDIF